MISEEDRTLFERIEHEHEEFQNLIDDIDSAHIDAFVLARNKFLTNEVTGRYEFSRLNNGDTAIAFATEMFNHYEAFLNTINSKVDNKFAQHLINKGLLGFTKDSLRDIILDKGSNFNNTLFVRQLTPQILQNVRQSLKPVLFTDLLERHMTPLVEYMAATSIVDASKMQLNDAVTLFNNYLDNEKHIVVGELPANAPYIIRNT